MSIERLKDEFPGISTAEDEINDNVSTLNTINYQIAELYRIKEELEKRVAALLQHGDDYSKTYLCNKFKVTVKTSYIYSLDKDEYEIMGSRLPSRFNPVTKKHPIIWTNKLYAMLRDSVVKKSFCYLLLCLVKSQQS